MRCRLVLLTVLTLLVVWIAPAAGQTSQPQRQWVKLADAPPDPAGREIAPGMLGAWVYESAGKGLLLYGGRSPCFNNGLWRFGPDGRWQSLRLDDTVAATAAPQPAGPVEPPAVLPGGEDKPALRTARPDEVTFSTDRPGAGDSHGVCYDPDNQCVWFLGGYRYGADGRQSWVNEGPLGLWRYDPAADKFAHVDPKAPDGVFRLAYDHARKRLVAAPALGRQNDYFTYDPAGAKWAKLAGPKAGDYPAMAYDPAARLAVLFTASGETWTFDGAEWKQAQPKVSPSARHHAGMAYAAELGGVALVGGLTNYGLSWVWVERGRDKIFQDVWAYDAKADTWREVAAAGLPKESSPKLAYCCDGLAYDAQRKSLVLHDPTIGVWSLPLGDQPLPAGLSSASGGKATFPARDARARQANPKLASLGENAWVNLECRVPGGNEVGLAYDPANRLIFKYGGCGTSPLAPGDYGYSNVLWVADVASGLWQCRRPTHMYGGAARPVNGCGRAYCFDANRKVIWTINAVSSHPTGGGYGLFSYDAAADCFEGPFGGPHSTSTALCHDPDEDILLLLNRKGQSYVFDCKAKTWSAAIAGPPTSGYDQIVYVPTLKLFVFPTRAETGQQVDQPDLAGMGPTRALPSSDKGKYRVVTMQTWAFDPKTRQWRDLAPNRQIAPPRTYYGVCYDSRNDVVLLTGGQNALWSDKPADEAPVSDVWAYVPKVNDWQQTQPVNPPPAGQLKAACVFDAEHGVMVTSINKVLWAYRYRK